MADNRNCQVKVSTSINDFRKKNDQMQDCRSTELSRLKGVTYVDHAGAALYAQSQLDAVHAELSSCMYGNPHSGNQSSSNTADLIEQARHRVLAHFNTTHDHYSVIFTSGATAAFKLLGEAFQFNRNEIPSTQDSSCDSTSYVGAMLYLDDNHTSVIGMREIAKYRGVQDILCITQSDMEDSIAKQSHPKYAQNSRKCSCKSSNLFIYPAQSNFCGSKYPLSWIQAIKEHGLCDLKYSRTSDKCVNKDVCTSQGTPTKCCYDEQNVCHHCHGNHCQGHSCPGNWFVCLDAAGLVSTSPLDLNVVQPDFVTVSFYKMFGYPTGIGALIVKKTSENILHKTYFGGGTVQVAVAAEDFHVKKTQLEDRFEDGTVNFLSILALRHGFDAMQKIGGSIADISLFTFHLAAILFHSLRSLQHSNGQPVIKLYHQGGFQSPRQQGPIVNFNVLRADGTVVGYSQVEKLAAAYNIELRTGCVCNLGACQRHLQLSAETVKKNFQAGHVCGDNMDLIDGFPTGSVRISFGYMSTMRDVEEIVQFIVGCFMDASSNEDLCSFTLQKAMDMVFNADTEENVQTENQPTRESVTDDKRLWPVASTVSDENSDQPFMNGSRSIQQRNHPIKKPNSYSEDHFDKSSHMTAADMCHKKKMELSRIFLYPVKSCAAMEVSTWEIGSGGLLYDREWMIVNQAGVCLTQKRLPKLCRILPKIDLKKGQLTLTCADSYLEALSVSLELQPGSKGCMSVCHSKVCGDRISVVDCGDEAAEWIEAALEVQGARLVRHYTQLNTRTARKAAGSSLSLANEAPYLLLNETSVLQLHAHLHTQLHDDTPDVNELIERFRGNLVIQGADGLEEESWRTLTIGNNIFQSVGACTRCQMICVDQKTGHKLKDMLPALTSFANKNEFGVLLRHCPADDEDVWRLSVGDTVSTDASHAGDSCDRD